VNNYTPDRRKPSEAGPSVLIADNHWLLRYGVKQLLAEEFRGIAFGEARTKREVLEELERRAWQAVSLELDIPGTRGLELLEEILQRQPEARVLVLTVHPKSQYASHALNLGALAYLTTDSPRVELLNAFKRVLAGERYIGRSKESVPAEIPVGPTHETLSPREFEVMLALSAGKRPGEIAIELNRSIKTVSTYKRRILEKMQLHNTADLIRYTIDHQPFRTWSSGAGDPLLVPADQTEAVVGERLQGRTIEYPTGSVQSTG
jgi:two-component system invasion response regulator UvrY